MPFLFLPQEWSVCLWALQNVLENNMTLVPRSTSAAVQLCAPPSRHILFVCWKAANFCTVCLPLMCKGEKRMLIPSYLLWLLLGIAGSGRYLFVRHNAKTQVLILNYFYQTVSYTWQNKRLRHYQTVHSRHTPPPQKWQSRDVRALNSRDNGESALVCLWSARSIDMVCQNNLCGTKVETAEKSGISTVISVLYYLDLETSRNCNAAVTVRAKSVQMCPGSGPYK